MKQSGEPNTVFLGVWGKVPLRIHLLTLFLFVAVAAGCLTAKQLSLAGYFIGGSLSLFLHDLAQALIGRRRGHPVRLLIWMPFGGISRVADEGQSVRQDSYIALGGIAVHAILAAILALIALTPSALARSLCQVNLALLLLNLLPAPPTDGGRLLTTLLSRDRAFADASQIVATTGIICALLLAALGACLGSFLCFAGAIFVWLGTMRTAQADRIRERLAGVTAADAMTRQFATLTGGDTLGAAARQLIDNAQRDFPVLQGGEVAGLLPRDVLLRGIAEKGSGVYVAEIMQRDFIHLSPETPLLEAVSWLHPTVVSAVLILEKDRLVGILTAEGVGRCLALRQLSPPSERFD